MIYSKFQIYDFYKKNIFIFYLLIFIFNVNNYLNIKNTELLIIENYFFLN